MGRQRPPSLKLRRVKQGGTVFNVELKALASFRDSSRGFARAFFGSLTKK